MIRFDLNADKSAWVTDETKQNKIAPLPCFNGKRAEALHCWVLNSSKVLLATTNALVVYDYNDLQKDPVGIDVRQAMPEGVSGWLNAADSCHGAQDINDFTFLATIGI